MKAAFTKFKITPTHCPFCGAINDGASSLDENTTKPPEKGSVTLCIQCGEWGVFDDVPGRLRKPTDAEYDVIASSEACRKARFAWVMAIGRKK